jgi:hypothetical protein
MAWPRIAVHSSMAIYTKRQKSVDLNGHVLKSGMATLSGSGVMAWMATF